MGPIYGRVQVVGMTVRQAETEIQKHLKEILVDSRAMVTRYDPLSGAGAANDPAMERRLLHLEEEVRELRVAVEKLQKVK